MERQTIIIATRINRTPPAPKTPWQKLMPWINPAELIPTDATEIPPLQASGCPSKGIDANESPIPAQAMNPIHVPRPGLPIDISNRRTPTANQVTAITYITHGDALSPGGFVAPT